MNFLKKKVAPFIVGLLKESIEEVVKAYVKKEVKKIRRK